MLLDCEAVVQLDNWWDSKCACAEFQIAVALGMQVYHFFDEAVPLLLVRAPLPRGER